MFSQTAYEKPECTLSIRQQAEMYDMGIKSNVMRCSRQNQLFKLMCSHPIPSRAQGKYQLANVRDTRIDSSLQS